MTVEPHSGTLRKTEQMRRRRSRGSARARTAPRPLIPSISACRSCASNLKKPAGMCCKFGYFRTSKSRFPLVTVLTHRLIDSGSSLPMHCRPSWLETNRNRSVRDPLAGAEDAIREWRLVWFAFMATQNTGGKIPPARSDTTGGKIEPAEPPKTAKPAREAGGETANLANR